MDNTTLFNLSCGLYIIGAKDGEKNAGCVVNTVTQSTAKPVTLTVCINKDNYTNGCIKKTKAFSVSILSENAKQTTIGVFGFSCSKDKDKFSGVPFKLTPNGLPYVNEGVTGFLQCKVIDFVDVYTHTIFIAEVEEAENLFKEHAMTYEYYHKVVKGKTPEKASSYVEEKKDANIPAKKYVCNVCGYEYPGSAEEFEKLPADFCCPICGVTKDDFSLK